MFFGFSFIEFAIIFVVSIVFTIIVGLLSICLEPWHEKQMAKRKEAVKRAEEKAKLAKKEHEEAAKKLKESKEELKKTWAKFLKNKEQFIN